MITLPLSTEMSPARAAIAARLEQEYENHTERLAFLTATPPRGNRLSNARRAAQHAEAVAAARRSLADVAQALRRLAEGTYGMCERCFEDIPQPDLEDAPATSVCRSCDAAAC